ncbi:MAG: hypothetical protein COA86_17975 [Kangiella sp.]|nr:MAG: hypothetical protein COA86_17975 [Kangiella sp.]
MSYLTDGVQLLSSSYRKIASSENFKRHSSEYELDSVSTERANEFFEWLNSSGSLCDNLSFDIKIGSATTISFSSGDKNRFNESIGLLNDDLLGREPDEQLKLSISIKKTFRSSNSKTEISIYSLADFSSYLSELGVLELADFLPEESIVDSIFVFNIMHETHTCQTQRFAFRSVYPVAAMEVAVFSLSKEERNHRVENRDKCGHFANAATMNYLPEDFVLDVPSSDANINSMFGALSAFYLMVFLCDFSVAKESLSVRLKGYKLITQDFSLAELEGCNTKELFEIYKWVYSHGSFADKIGLARNLISIHLKNGNLLTLDEGTVHSVESGYDIYLKDNVKQYIEIKNKLSEFIQSASDKANSITQSMFSSMKNSLWGFISFFISVFFLKVISKGTFDGIVSTDILIISYGILVVSMVLLWVSRIETATDKSRFQTAYFSLKDRYKDLLNDKDLNRILQNDKVYNEDIAHIDSRKELYTKSWIGITIIMGIVVTSLWFFNPPKPRPSSKSATIPTQTTPLPHSFPKVRLNLSLNPLSQPIEILATHNLII